jgi:hypothetical protein
VKGIQYINVIVRTMARLPTAGLSDLFAALQARLHPRVCAFYESDIPLFGQSSISHEIALLTLSESLDSSMIDTTISRYISDLQRSNALLGQIISLRRDILRLRSENTKLRTPPPESHLDAFQRDSLANLRNQIDRDRRAIDNLQIQLDFAHTRMNLLRGSRGLTASIQAGSLPDLRAPLFASPRRMTANDDRFTLLDAASLSGRFSIPEAESTILPSFRSEDIELPGAVEILEEDVEAILSASDMPIPQNPETGLIGMRPVLPEGPPPDRAGRPRFRMNREAPGSG